MSYFTDRNKTNTTQLREIVKTLPDFCSEYFIGIGSISTPLTRLNYARDYKLFFYYLVTELPKFAGLTVELFSINDLEKVTSTDIESYIEYLSYYIYNGKHHSNNEYGKSRKLSSIRALFKYLFNKNLLSKNIAAKVSMPKKHDKEIIRLDKREVTEVLEEAEHGYNLNNRQLIYHRKTQSRDVALLTLFLGTGIRISECVGLDLDDINFKDNSFTVTRKGGNRTILYFGEEVANALKWYLEHRNNNPDVASNEKALFLSLNNKRISIRSVQNLVQKYCKIVSPLKKISPHKLRSTFGTELYRQTKDIYVVAEVLGHKDINTTKKHYAAISEDIKRNAINTIRLSDKE